jgi:hypothetical protein
MQCRGIYSIRPAPQQYASRATLNRCGPVRRAKPPVRPKVMPLVTRRPAQAQPASRGTLWLCRARVARLSIRAGAGDVAIVQLALTLAICLAWLGEPLETRSVRKQSQAGADNPIFVALILHARNMPRLPRHGLGGSRQPHICRLNFARSQHNTAASSWLRGPMQCVQALKRAHTTPYLWHWPR